MANKHIVESLVETSKKITEISNTIENDSLNPTSKQKVIAEINNAIRQLDHVVESLEKS